MHKLACNADAALQRASSVASDLSTRVAQAETQQASASLTAKQAQARSEAALKETEDVRHDQQIAYARMEAELQIAATKSQATANHAAAQAAQAIPDARNATVEVPRLDATMSCLHQELQAMKVATQQAQERAMRLETELSTTQDCIGAIEREAAQAEQRHAALQQRMDDWDAFDPDLHAALQASVTPPSPGTGYPAQPAATASGSVPQAQAQTTARSRLPVKSSTFRSTGTSGLFPFVQQAQPSVHQAQTGPPPANLNGGAVDSTGGSDISLVFPGVGGSSNGVNGGSGPSFPPRNYGSPSQQNRGSAFTVQVKPKDPPIFHGRASEDVVTWTSKVQDFFYMTEAGDA